MNALIITTGTPHIALFTPDASLCEPLKMSVCGTFFSNEAANGLQLAVDGYMGAFLDAAIGGDVCTPELEGYSVVVSTTDVPALLPVRSPSIDLTRSFACSLAAVSKPNCT